MDKKIYYTDNINNYIFNDFELGQIKKTIVNYVVIIFGIIIVLIFVLLILYYLTPNNYETINLDDSKLKFSEQIVFVVKPNSTTKIDFSNNIATYLKFPRETTVIFKNIFKSQNIHIDKDNNKLIKPKYNSEIFLVNNSDLEKKNIVDFYLLS